MLILILLKNKIEYLFLRRDFYMKKGKSNIVLIVIISLVTGIITSFSTAYLYLHTNLSINKGENEIKGEDGTIYKIEQVENPVVAIAEIAGKSVVGIKVNVKSNLVYQTSSSSEGSGIIYNENGYIITNYHVIESAIKNSQNSTIYVTFSNSDEELEAKYIGGDEVTDLAVIKVEKEGLTAATFGDSDILKVGELAVAIGNPLGQELAGSVTVGYISALNRTLTTDGRTYKLVQTDAAINPGNSGGALVNSKGEIIGINTVKIGATEVEGIGFAIPMNIAKPIIEELIINGKVARPFVGIGTIDVNEIISKIYKIPQGVYIAKIEENSPADKFGLKVGDVIIKVDGKEIKEMSEFNNIKNTKNIGDEINLTVSRDGKEINIKLVLASDSEN